MLAFGPFQALLDAIGWVLASIFDLVPNYGASIVILTLVIRLILFPLGMKQIKSMQAMQAIQPRVKELQKKYKGNKQKAQEETMKLYKEAGVNPLGGCLPLLLQFPILIAMYAVIRAPLLAPVDGQPQTYMVKNNHLPEDSTLFKDVITHTNTSVIIVNLQCSAAQSGSQAQLNDTSGQPVQNGWALQDGQGNPLPYTSIGTLDCGSSPSAKIPYFLLLVIMIATTFYQQRQMQKASPPGAASSQQQQIMKFMPLMFGIFGFTFPAGLVLYWMVSNVFQIGQQAALLRAGHIGPDALDRRIAEQKAKAANQADQPAKKGFMAGMMERADQARQQAGDGKGGSSGRGSGKGSQSKGTNGSGGAKGGPRKPPPKNQPRPKPKKPGGTDGS